jgi:hypothetical protein
MTIKTFAQQIVGLGGILLLSALSTAELSNAQERRPPREGPPSTSEIQYVRQQAVIYRIDPADAVKNYGAMFDPDQMAAGQAGWFFEQRKAYTILAAALPNLSGTVYALAIDALVSKKTFDHAVFQALVQELDSVNAIPDSEGDANTDPGANETLKLKICTALARWLSLPELNIDRSSHPFADFAAFSAQAKQKAATTTVSSPY